MICSTLERSEHQQVRLIDPLAAEKRGASILNGGNYPMAESVCCPRGGSGAKAPRGATLGAKLLRHFKRLLGFKSPLSHFSPSTSAQRVAT